MKNGNVVMKHYSKDKTRSLKPTAARVNRKTIIVHLTRGKQTLFLIRMAPTAYPFCVFQ